MCHIIGVASYMKAVSANKSINFTTGIETFNTTTAMIIGDIIFPEVCCDLCCWSWRFCSCNLLLSLAAYASVMLAYQM